MVRKICAECPFNPISKNFKYRNDWAKILENRQFEDGYEMPQGCHMLPEAQKDSTYQKNPELQCIGHIEYMKKKQVGDYC